MQDLDDVAALYLELLKGTLSRSILGSEFIVEPPLEDGIKGRLFGIVSQVLSTRNYLLAKRFHTDAEQRDNGSGPPPMGETMIGRKRLDNLQQCAIDVIKDGVEGDLIETGVWRGGACILMRGVLKAYGDVTRKVWVADSFAGLPAPELDRYPQDEGDDHFTRPELAISVDQVRDNFRRYDLLDDQVKFLKGWFRDTLPAAPIDRLSVIRLDGDMYSSTMDAITALYPKLSVGGYLIVDDYGAIPTCKAAIDDFRRDNDISDPIRTIDWTGVYWRRTA